MNANNASYGDTEEILQEFQFSPPYVGAGPPAASDARSQRQAKRRGLWQSCFAPPLVKETKPTASQLTAPSHLVLTTRQLVYNRQNGAEPPVVCRMPLSDISIIEVKWVAAAGARVSKVTFRFRSGQEPVVVRGLQSPQEVVAAVEKQRYEVLHHQTADTATQSSLHVKPSQSVLGLGTAGVEPAAAAADGAAGAGTVHHLGRRPLPRDSPVSSSSKPAASAPNSSFSGMTLLSPFARSPAQQFSDAAVVARDLQIASSRFGSRGEVDAAAPGEEVFGVPAGTVTPQRPVGGGATPRTLTSASKATPLSAARAPLHAIPSDSFVVRVGAAAGRGTAVVSSPRSPQPTSQMISGVPSPGGPDREVVVTPTRHGTPSEGVFYVGGSPPPLVEDSVMTSRVSPSTLARTGDGAPPPVAEDSVTEGASLQLSPLQTPVGAGTVYTVRAVARGQSPDGQRSQSAGARSTGAGAGQLSQVSPGEGQPQSECGSTSASPPVPVLGQSPPVQPQPHARQERPQEETTQRQAEGTGRQLHRSVPAPMTDAGSWAAVAAAARGRVGSAASFKSADSAGGDSAPDGASAAATPAGLTRREEGVVDVAEVGSSPGPVAPDSSPAPDTNGSQSRKGVTAVGAMGIAAAAATMSAVLTTAASAGLSSVGLAAAPSVTAAASSSVVAAAAPATAAAAASVVAAPLTLLGITAAAAVTMLAAAAVTHIRTGSPVRPVGSPSNAEVLESQRMLSARRGRSVDWLIGSPPPLLLAAPPPPHSPAAGASDAGSGKVASPGVPSGVMATVVIPLPGSAMQLQQQKSVSSIGVGDSSVYDNEPSVAFVHAWQAASPVHANYSINGALGPRNAAAGASAANGLSPNAGVPGDLTGDNVRPKGLGGDEHDSRAIGAEWGLQQAVAPDLHAAPVVVMGGGTAVGTAVPPQPAERDEAAASTRDPARGSGGVSEPMQDFADVAMVGRGPLGYPASTSRAAPEAPLWNGRVAAFEPAEDVPVVHGGELRPPPAAYERGRETEASTRGALAIPSRRNGAHQSGQLEPHWRHDNTARQLFYSNDGTPEPRTVVSHQQQLLSPAPHPYRPQSQGADEEVYAAVAYQRSQPPGFQVASRPSLRSPTPDATAGGQPSPHPGTSPHTLSHRRQVHLTESPVRVLYSIHASFTGLPDTLSVRRLLPTCESWVQTEVPAAPVAESAVQTELEARRSGSRSGPPSDPGSTRTAAGDLAAPLATSAAAEAASIAGLQHEEPPISMAKGAIKDIGETSRMCSQGSGVGGNAGSRNAGRGQFSQRQLLKSVTQEVYALPGEEQGDGKPGSGAAKEAGAALAAASELPVVGAKDWYLSSLGGADERRASFNLGTPAAPGVAARQSRDVSPSSSRYMSASHSHSSPPSGQQGGSQDASSRDACCGGILAAAPPEGAREWHQTQLSECPLGPPATGGPRNQQGGDSQDEEQEEEDRVRLLDRGVVESSSAVVPSVLSRSRAPSAGPFSPQPSPPLGSRSALGLGATAATAAGHGSALASNSEGSETTSTSTSPSTSLSEPLDSPLGSGLYSRIASEASPSSEGDGAVVHMQLDSNDLSKQDETESCPGHSSRETDAPPHPAAHAAEFGEVGFDHVAQVRDGEHRASAVTSGSSCSTSHQDDRSSTGDTADAEQGQVEDGVDSEVRLLSPRVGLSAEPLTPHVPSAAKLIRPADLYKLQGSPSSDTADDMVWLLGPDPASGRSHQGSEVSGSESALTSPSAPLPHAVVPGNGGWAGSGTQGSSSSSGQHPQEPAEPASAEGSSVLGTMASGNAYLRSSHAALDVVSGSEGVHSSNLSSNAVHTPKTPHMDMDSGGTSTTNSPELSDISSTAFAGGYGYAASPRTSPYSAASPPPPGTMGASPAAVTADSVAADAASLQAGSPGVGREDLFHNPLYITPGSKGSGTSAEGSPGEEGRGRGTIALKALSDGDDASAYGGMYGADDDVASSCLSSRGPHSYATSQPSVGGGSETPASGRRRRRGHKSPLGSPYSNGTPRQRYGSSSGSEIARAEAAWGAWSGPSGGATPRGPKGLGSPGGHSSASSGSPQDRPQPVKRARTRMPDAPIALPPLHSIASAPVGGAGAAVRQSLPPGASLRRTHSSLPPPLASPLMVLNPAYATSEAGAPSVAGSPRHVAAGDVAALAVPLGAAAPSTGVEGRSEAAPAEAVATRAGVEAAALVLGGTGRRADGEAQESGGASACTGSGSATGFVTPKQLLQSVPGLEAGWSSGKFQGSPSSQQAAHAAALLRHANEAVDFARDAVQRGDGQWLSRVTATLQAVQTALDALREF